MKILHGWLIVELSLSDWGATISDIDTKKNIAVSFPEFLMFVSTAVPLTPTPKCWPMGTPALLVCLSRYSPLSTSMWSICTAMFRFVRRLDQTAVCLWVYHTHTHTQSHHRVNKSEVTTSILTESLNVTTGWMWQKSLESFLFMFFQDCLQRTSRSSHNTIATAFGSTGPLLKSDEGKYFHTGSVYVRIMKHFSQLQTSVLLCKGLNLNRNLKPAKAIQWHCSFLSTNGLKFEQFQCLFMLKDWKRGFSFGWNGGFTWMKSFCQSKLNWYIEDIM